MNAVGSDLWYALPVLTGTLIRLEPLKIEHSEGNFAAAGTGDDAAEVFRWFSERAPVSAARTREQVAAGLAARAAGIRSRRPRSTR